MSSSGFWDEDQGSSRAHQRTSMQADRISFRVVTRWMRSESGIVYVLGLLGLVLGGMLSLLLLKDSKAMLQLLVQLLGLEVVLVLPGLVMIGVLMLLAVVPVQTFDRNMIFRRTGRGGRLMKWGPREWVLDSGAGNHHTSNLELLLDGGDFQFLEMDRKDARSRGDDAAAPDVQGRGSVRMDCFYFPGVHYVVGDDTRNVVSVSQLFRDHGLVTVFQPTSCHVKEEKTGKIVGKGRRLQNGMYILDSLHIGQYIAGDQGASSGGERGDGGDGGSGHGGEGDSSMAEGHGGGTGASSNQEHGGSGSGAAGGDINDKEKNGNGEEEKDKKRGDGSTFGESSSKACKGLSGFVLVLCLCIAACLCTRWRTGVTILLMGFCSLLGFMFLLILSLSMTNLVKQIGFLFGISRFDDVTTDPTGHGRYQLPAGAFPSTTNTALWEEFIVDSGASFHATWNKWILVPYPKALEAHTEPPTRSFGGIIGSIAVKTSGYLSSDKIKLDGVLLAPESRMNLVSVGQLSVQYDVDVIFGERVVIKRRQDGVQIGGGKMFNNHQYELEYFKPGYLFAVSPTPDFKIFGTRDPGEPHVTVPCPTRSTTTEETGADSEETGAGHKSRSVRKRRPNWRFTGPMWNRYFFKKMWSR